MTQTPVHLTINRPNNTPIQPTGAKMTTESTDPELRIIIIAL